jgi:polyisoprenoid-binding protein YceI
MANSRLKGDMVGWTSRVLPRVCYIGRNQKPLLQKRKELMQLRNNYRQARATTLALLLTLGLDSAVQAADTYKLDPAHSTVGFAVSHMVINTVRGKFDQFTGTVTLADNAVQEAAGTIQTKSVNTGVEMRDKDLRSSNFFDVEKYPTITFQSKRTEKKGGDVRLVGDFTMHGVTKEISLPVIVKGPVKDPWGNTRIGLEAKAKLNRRDYGLLYSKLLETGGLVVGDEVEIEINAEAVKAKAE